MAFLIPILAALAPFSLYVIHGGPFLAVVSFTYLLRRRETHVCVALLAATYSSLRTL